MNEISIEIISEQDMSVLYGGKSKSYDGWVWDEDLQEWVEDSRTR